MQATTYRVKRRRRGAPSSWAGRLWEHINHAGRSGQLTHAIAVERRRCR